MLRSLVTFILISMLLLSCAEQKRTLVTMNTYYTDLLDIFDEANVICNHKDKSLLVSNLKNLEELSQQKDGSVKFPFGKFIDGALRNEGAIKIMYDLQGKEYFTFQYKIITQESEDYYLDGKLVAEGQVYEDRGRVRCKCDQVIN